MYYIGQPVEFNIDDKLPVRHGDLINADKSLNNAWWMPLLEKAYAKFNINYLQLNGGNEIEALVALTGKPTATYDAADYTNDALFDLIHDAD